MQKSKISFSSIVPGLETIEECCPKPSRHYIPSWWKSFPKQEPFPATQTVKVCPSFPQFFSQGYVLPMWADLHLEYNKENEFWSYTIGRPGDKNPFSLEQHSNDQFLDYVIPSIQGKNIIKIFKLVTPWLVFAPKGYSLLQLPMFYHFNQDFSVFPGVIDPERHTGEINLQIALHEGRSSIIVKRGTPIAQYIPFKRTENELVVGPITQDQYKTYQKRTLNVFSKFLGGGAYNALKKGKDSV